MHTPETLLARLDAIGRSLAAGNETLALRGMGSVGVELERLDAHSNLDFFAVVSPAMAERIRGLAGLLGVVLLRHAPLPLTPNPSPSVCRCRVLAGALTPNPSP
jgi:hypothetical protein